MRTDDIVRLLVADNAGAIREHRRRLAPLALLAAAAATGLVFAWLVGWRSDLATSATVTIVVSKLVFALAITAVGLALARFLASPVRPERDRGVLLLIPVVLGAALIMAEIVTQGASGWYARLLGSSSFTCLTAIPLLAVLPLAACLFWLREGASSHPALAGAAAGLAAGGLGASIYAFYCIEDSALFFTFWYMVAIAGVTVAGSAFGRRWLTW
jgi:hypothetical protein